MDGRQLVEIFKNPGATYYPCVMWFWNDRISESEIEFQIKEFQKSKINEFFIHPLEGMELRYMGDEFFALIRFAVSKAAELGMKFWIYDEYNWPSGTAGGLLLKEKPETLGCVLMVTKITLYAGQPLDHSFEGKFVCASALHKNKTARRENITAKVAVSEENGRTRVRCDIGSCSTVEVALAYAAPSVGLCASSMWSSFSEFTPGWLDANDKKSVDDFIDCTHERYKKEIGDEFGKTVLGVFSDEANNFSFFDEAYYNVPQGQFPSLAYPWSKSFAEEFFRDHGYDFEPYAYAADCSFKDADSIKKRYDYWETLVRIFSQNYVKNIGDWCHSNNLKLTGHLSGEDSILWHAYQMGDSYLALKEFHIPGIDNLFSKNHVGNIDFALTAKFAASAAKLAGRKRVLCETFSGSGWDLSLQEMKRCLHRLILAGINMTQYMGAYYSIDCGRKHLPLSYPPSHGYNNPLFSHYGELGAYAARLNALCAETVQASGIFVLLPVISVQMDRNLQGNLDFGWRNVCEALIKKHFEYDIASERALHGAKAENGRLLAEGFEYSLLIVPDMYFTSQKTIDAIDGFIGQNGKVVFCGNTEFTICESGETIDYKNRINGMNAIAAKANPENFDFEKFAENLSFAIGSDLKALDICGDIGNIYVSRRKTDDGCDLFMIANENAESAKITAKVKNSKNGFAYLLEASEAKISPLDFPVFETDICAYGCVAVLVSENPIISVESAQIYTPKEKKSTIELKENWSFEAKGGNWLVLPVKMQTESKNLLNLYDFGFVEQFISQSAEEYGKLGSIAESEFAGGYGIRPGDRYAAHAGIYIHEIPANAEIVAECEEGMVVLLNGIDISDNLKNVKLWGIRTKSADISPILKKGLNHFAYISKMPGWMGPHELPCAYLRGDFKLNDRLELIKNTKEIEPNIWTAQGYPHFSGIGAYETQFELPDIAGKKISIEIPTGDAVKIVLNGKEAKTLLWKPYVADISKFAKKGENRLRLEFTSTYKNLMQTQEYELLRQGHIVRSGKSKPAHSGLEGFPVIHLD